MSRRRTDLAAFSALALVTAVAFRGVARGELFYFGDFHESFVPRRECLGEALRVGLPLWNPHLSNGQPLLASPVSSALYPPNLAFAIAGAPAEQVLTLLTVAHVFWGALGAWFAARRLGHAASGAWVAAVVYGFCGFSISATYAPLLTITAAWIPWLVLAHDRLVSTSRTGRAVAIVAFGLVVGAMILAGEPFTILIGILGIALLAIVPPPPAQCRE